MISISLLSSCYNFWYLTFLMIADRSPLFPIYEIFLEGYPNRSQKDEELEVKTSFRSSLN